MSGRRVPAILARATRRQQQRAGPGFRRRRRACAQLVLQIADLIAEAVRDLESASLIVPFSPSSSRSL